MTRSIVSFAWVSRASGRRASGVCRFQHSSRSAPAHASTGACHENPGRTLKKVIAALVMTAVAPATANAGLILTLSQSSSSSVVNLTYSGFVTTSDLALDASPTNTANFISPVQGRIRKVGAVDIYETNSNSIPQAFGVGSQVLAISGSGSAIRINFEGPGFIGVPSGYASNAAIFGTMTFAGTIASLGVTPGTYMFEWGVGGAGRTVTLDVVAVPEPATSTMGVVAIGSILGGYFYRRRIKYT